MQPTEELKAQLKLKTYRDLNCIYNTDAKASDGSILLGRGVTSEQSIEDAAQKLLAYELFLSKPARERLLETLLNTPQWRLCDHDKERCIRLIAEILLQDNRVRGY